MAHTPWPETAQNSALGPREHLEQHGFALFRDALPQQLSSDLRRLIDGDGSAVNVPGDQSPGEGRGEPPASRGMTLGSVWRGPTPGPDEMLDVLVPEADGYARLEGGGEAREG